MHHVAIHNAVGFPETQQSQHCKQRMHPLYSDKHNAAIVVFKLAQRNKDAVCGGVYVCIAIN